MKIRFRYCVSFTTLFFSLSVFSTDAFCQKDSLSEEIKSIARASGGNVGVALVSIEDGEVLTVNGSRHFPMQSVYKFPLAMAILQQVDSGKLKLDQKIHLTKKNLSKDTWSPLRDKYPKANIDVTLRDLLFYMVSYSDNNACDILFRLIGGPLKVQKFIHAMGFRNIAIVATENQMHKTPDVQFKNWCDPVTMAELLTVFYRKTYLSPATSELLMKLMTESLNSPKRIKGLLPEGTAVAHKTGTSGTNEAGISAAMNDVGIVTLPNGKHFAIVVYVSMSKADSKVLEDVIAQIAKAAWDYYIAKK